MTAFRNARLAQCATLVPALVARARRIVGGGLVALALFDAAAAQGGGTTDAPSSSKGPARNGLQFVFDASGSMCGFKKAPVSDGSILLKMIEFAGKNYDGNSKSMVLDQRSLLGVPADIRDAPPDLQQKFGTSEPCKPFTGAGSNVSLVFSDDVAAPPRSIVLVSDMQLGETGERLFVDQFRAWALEQDPKMALNAGIVTFGAPFAGPYYAVDTDAKKDKSATILPPFRRPLSVLWFLAGDQDIATVRTVLDRLGVFAPGSAGAAAPVLYGLQVLPTQTEDRTRWLQSYPPVSNAEALFSKRGFAVRMSALQRDIRTVTDCVAMPSLHGNEIVMTARRKCGDDQPLFFEIDAVEATLQVDHRLGLAVKPAGDAVTVKLDTLTIPFRRPMIDGKPLSVHLQLSSVGDPLSDARLNAMTLRDDSCDAKPPPSADGKPATKDPKQACAAMLDGKVYRYSTLIQQFAQRAHDVSEKRANDIAIDLKYRFLSQ